ncbi:SatD family protein [Dokdonia sp. Hel_I_53]|uniref:SatD family protein n=1 Tax=Dokdonia sp. Hel_I_53 TaxID=1566287 RepID=UPI0011990671|nr:SatD family protein [Dokdonia sp. Hel_I_53]TVZ51790.1 SatD family protein [Dokdonia sp. Hel_I_53]
MKKLVAVLTGDIINSREEKVTNWMPELKSTLERYGPTPENWEIYRGDSFQLMLPASDGFIAALHIKATIKKFRSIDVRISIGLGTIDHAAKRITESNGSAFLHSGEGFENLKKQTLAITSNNTQELQAIHIMIDLAMLVANNWTPSVAQLIQTYIEHPDRQQKEIAQLLNKSQSTVSETLSRSGYEEIIAIQHYYKQLIPKQ